MNFTQYKTKEAFLRKYPIENGQLNLSNKGITDDDLKHIVELLGNELSVEVLSLYNNQLTEIHPDTFKGISSLERLYLDNNKLTTIHPDTFKGLSSLKWLSLPYNQLTTIHPDTFKGLSSLKWLSLPYNQLTEIHPDTFKGISSLERLYLYNNQLTEIHPDTFKGLSSLKWLYLYDNQFTQLHKSIREMLPDCSIYTNDNIKWVDDVEERQDVNNVTENCITKLKNQISKLNDYLNDITIYDFTKKYKIKAIIQCIILSILTTYLIILVFHFLITTIC